MLNKTDVQFVGVWDLESFEMRSSNNSIFFPYGSNPIGRLIYTASKYMSANLTCSDYSKFNYDNPLLAAPYEWANVGKNNICYSGKYSTDDKYIYHEVDYSLFPNWIGTILQREYAFKDDKLVLIADVDTLESGLFYKAYLVWKKTG